MDDMSLDEAIDTHAAIYTRETGVNLALTALQYYRDGMIGPGSFVEAIQKIVGAKFDVPALVFAELLKHCPNKEQTNG